MKIDPEQPLPQTTGQSEVPAYERRHDPIEAGAVGPRGTADITAHRDYVPEPDEASDGYEYGRPAPAGRDDEP